MKVSKRRKMLAAFAISIAAGASALGVGMSTTPAFALAQSCSWGNEGSFSWAQCTSGSGWFRAWAQGAPDHWWNGGWTLAYGPWEWPGQYVASYAGCPSGHHVASYGISYG